MKAKDDELDAKIAEFKQAISEKRIGDVIKLIKQHNNAQEQHALLSAVTPELAQMIINDAAIQFSNFSAIVELVSLSTTNNPFVTEDIFPAAINAICYAVYRKDFDSIAKLISIQRQDNPFANHAVVMGTIHHIASYGDLEGLTHLIALPEPNPFADPEIATKVMEGVIYSNNLYALNTIAQIPAPNLFCSAAPRVEPEIAVQLIQRAVNTRDFKGIAKLISIPGQDNPFTNRAVVIDAIHRIASYGDLEGLTHLITLPEPNPFADPECINPTVVAQIIHIAIQKAEAYRDFNTIHTLVQLLELNLFLSAVTPDIAKQVILIVANYSIEWQNWSDMTALVRLPEPNPFITTEVACQIIQHAVEVKDFNIIRNLTQQIPSPNPFTTRTVAAQVMRYILKNSSFDAINTLAQISPPNHFLGVLSSEESAQVMMHALEVKDLDVISTLVGCLPPPNHFLNSITPAIAAEVIQHAAKEQNIQPLRILLSLRQPNPFATSEVAAQVIQHALEVKDLDIISTLVPLLKDIFLEKFTTEEAQQVMMHCIETANVAAVYRLASLKQSPNPFATPEVATSVMQYALKVKNFDVIRTLTYIPNPNYFLSAVTAEMAQQVVQQAVTEGDLTAITTLVQIIQAPNYFLSAVTAEMAQQVVQQAVTEDNTEAISTLMQICNPNPFLNADALAQLPTNLANMVVLQIAHTRNIEAVERLVSLPIDPNPFSINAEFDGQTVASYFHNNPAVQHRLFALGYVPRGGELLPISRAADQDLAGVARAAHGASIGGPAQEAVKFYVAEAEAQTAALSPQYIPAYTDAFAKRLLELKAQVNNGDFSNVPQALLNMSLDQKVDVFMDYYLKGEQLGGYSPSKEQYERAKAELADKVARDFKDNHTAAAEIINRTADFVNNTIMRGGYRDSELPKLIGITNYLQQSKQGQENSIELIKELYMAATAYGTDLGHPSCIPGTVQRISNAICYIRPDFTEKYWQQQGGVADHITDENVKPLADEMAAKLMERGLESSADGVTLPEHIEDFVLGVKDPYGEEGYRADGKMLRMFNQLFKESIIEALPAFGNRLPYKREMEILIKAILETEVVGKYQTKAAAEEAAQQAAMKAQQGSGDYTRQQYDSDQKNRAICELKQKYRILKENQEALRAGVTEDGEPLSEDMRKELEQEAAGIREKLPDLEKPVQSIIERMVKYEQQNNLPGTFPPIRWKKAEADQQQALHSPGLVEYTEAQYQEDVNDPAVQAMRQLLDAISEHQYLLESGSREDGAQLTAEDHDKIAAELRKMQAELPAIEETAIPILRRMQQYELAQEDRATEAPQKKQKATTHRQSSDGRRSHSASPDLERQAKSIGEYIRPHTAGQPQVAGRRGQPPHMRPRSSSSHGPARPK